MSNAVRANFAARSQERRRALVYLGDRPHAHAAHIAHITHCIARHLRMATHGTAARVIRRHVWTTGRCKQTYPTAREEQEN